MQARAHVDSAFGRGWNAASEVCRSLMALHSQNESLMPAPSIAYVVDVKLVVG